MYYEEREARTGERRPGPEVGDGEIVIDPQYVAEQDSLYADDRLSPNMRIGGVQDGTGVLDSDEVVMFKVGHKGVWAWSDSM